MSDRYLVQMMSLVLGGVMLLLVVVAWQFLGMALTKHQMLYRLYRLVTVVVMVGVLAAGALFVLSIL